MVLRFGWVRWRPSRFLVLAELDVLHCGMAAALAYGHITSARLNDGVTVLCWRLAQATARSTSPGGTLVTLC
jgi:hypothetical protein